MVIESGDKRIALECDGEKWHTQDDLMKDLKRQAILERMGWTFIRIRGSAFYRDPEVTMKAVFAKLETYGLHPNYSLDIQPNIKDNELIERVKRRANEIRQSWHLVEDEDEAAEEGEKEIEDKANTVIKAHEEAAPTEEKKYEDKGVTDKESKADESEYEINIKDKVPSVVRDDKLDQREDAVYIEEKLDKNELNLEEPAPKDQTILEHTDEGQLILPFEVAQAVGTEKSNRKNEFRQLDFDDLLSNSETNAKARYDFRNQTVRRKSSSSEIKENKKLILVEKNVSDQVKQDSRIKQKPLFDFREKNRK